jgi:hypothetical protein
MTEHSRSQSPEAKRREARLAAALRENLKRRKAQARARRLPADGQVADSASDLATGSKSATSGENATGVGVLPQSGGE